MIILWMVLYFAIGILVTLVYYEWVGKVGEDEPVMVWITLWPITVVVLILFGSYEALNKVFQKFIRSVVEHRKEQEESEDD